MSRCWPRVARQMTDDGFEVFAVDGARRALQLLEAARPALLLLDAVLPGASGFELCSRLRPGEPGRAWNRDIGVIMASSRGGRSSPASCWRAVFFTIWADCGLSGLAEVLTPYPVRCRLPNLAPRRALQLACTARRLSSVEAPPRARVTMWSACRGSVAVGGWPHSAHTDAACLT